MLTEIYIEAILTDSKLADEVWELWDAREITNDLAVWGWCILAETRMNKGHGEAQTS